MTAFDDITVLVGSLRPAAFYQRVDEWRRGDLPSGAGSERVGGSRSAKLPSFDRLDRALNRAEAEYRQCTDLFVAAMSQGDHRAALRFATTLYGLEVTWLFPVEIAAEDLAELVSDEPACVKCHATKEMWLASHRTLWRRKRGMCLNCYEAWRAAGSPLDVYPDKIEAEAS